MPGIRVFSRSLLSQALRVSARQTALISRGLHNSPARFSNLGVQKLGSSVFLRKDALCALSSVRNFARLPENEEEERDPELEALAAEGEVEDVKDEPVKGDGEGKSMPDKRQSRPRRGRKPELIGDDKLPRLPIALTIDINKVALVRKGGKTIRFAALVICGNGKGVAAIGRGKDKEVAVAVEKAVWDAHKKKNIHYFETYDNRTMFHSVVTKYKKTKIIAMPARAGTGLQCSLNVARMCQAIGIKDIKVKIHGSTNAHNVTRGFWNALLQVMTPERYSEMTGRVLVDFASLSGGFGRGHTTLPKIDEKLDKML